VEFHTGKSSPSPSLSSSNHSANFCRRGYLFHGEPGTGKTSLSFAIAGVFGLEIYCISLLEPTLTEEDLGMLFNSLPRRCVVLLEDIDSAGLHRRDDDAQDGDTAAPSAGKGGGRNRAGSNTGSREFAKEFARAIKSVNDKNDRNNSDKKQGISLSGLLNAIDGVASHEGRVLIMTTNCPEKLDEALIRPGRVDMKIEFSLATEEQIRELFIRMYSSDSTKRARILANGHIAPDDDITKEEPHAHANGVMSNGSVNGIPTKLPSPPMTPIITTTSFPPSKPIPKPTPNSSSSTGLSHSEILHLAAEFASKLPESTFSPAEIQGFLLTRKKDPRKAVAEVDHWRDKVREAKEARKNILSNGVARDSDEDEGGDVEAREATGGGGE
jgi:chaperone BCS1